VFYPSNGFFGAIVSRQKSTAWVDGATWVPEGSAVVCQNDARGRAGPPPAPSIYVG
jgi:hypothetical protein